MDGWIVMPRWDEFQHRDMARSEMPPWIKNYTKLLSDDAYLELTASERGILHGLWLEYARARRALRGDTASITRRLGVRVTEKTLTRLNHAGFIEFSASKPAGKVAVTEKRREEVEKKNPYIPFERLLAKKLELARQVVRNTGDIDRALDFLHNQPRLTTDERHWLEQQIRHG